MLSQDLAQKRDITYMRRANMSSSASVKVLTFAEGKVSHEDVLAKVVAKHQDKTRTGSKCTAEQISLEPSGLARTVKQSGAFHFDVSVPRPSVDGGTEARSGVDTASGRKVQACLGCDVRTLICRPCPQEMPQLAEEEVRTRLRAGETEGDARPGHERQQLLGRTCQRRRTAKGDKREGVQCVDHDNLLNAGERHLFLFASESRWPFLPSGIHHHHLHGAVSSKRCQPHDGAQPLISWRTFTSLFKTEKGNGCSVPSDA